MSAIKLASLCQGERERIEKQRRKRKERPQNSLQRRRGLRGSNHPQTLRKSLVPRSWFERGPSTKQLFKLSQNHQQTLKAKPRLKPLGKRGKRMATEDAKARAKIKGLSCLCGCNAGDREGCQWMHLQRRNIIETRWEDWATAPGCDTLHGWLDQGKGVKARRELFELAQKMQRRLTREDAYPILSRWGYYTDLHYQQTQD